VSLTSRQDKPGNELRRHLIEERGARGLDLCVEVYDIVLQLARLRAQGQQLVHAVNEFLPPFPTHMSLERNNNKLLPEVVVALWWWGSTTSLRGSL
jgi:hypothetical protein